MQIKELIEKILGKLLKPFLQNEQENKIIADIFQDLENAKEASFKLAKMNNKEVYEFVRENNTKNPSWLGINSWIENVKLEIDLRLLRELSHSSW